MKPWGPRPASPTKTSLWQTTTKATTAHLSMFAVLLSLIARIATGTMYVAVDHSIYQPDNLSQHPRDGEQAS